MLAGQCMSVTLQSLAPEQLREWAIAAPKGQPILLRIMADPASVLPATLQDALGSTGRVWLAASLSAVFPLSLGLSLWYVSRRLYGSLGGLVALALYCSSPLVPFMGGEGLPFASSFAPAWGAYGAVFCSVAVAHTLYAPRPVVLWNARRILLLAISMVLAACGGYRYVVLLPLVLCVIWYLAPVRRKAAAAILAAAVVVALFALWAGHAFSASALWQTLRMDNPLHGHAAASALQEQIYVFGPALVMLTPIAAGIVLVWKRARYFGNVGPLVAAAVLLLSGQLLGCGRNEFLLGAALPFLCQMIGGVTADLAETKVRWWWLAALGIVIVSAWAESLRLQVAVT